MPDESFNGYLGSIEAKSNNYHTNYLGNFAIAVLGIRFNMTDMTDADVITFRHAIFHHSG